MLVGTKGDFKMTRHVYTKAIRPLREPTPITWLKGRDGFSFALEALADSHGLDAVGVYKATRAIAMALLQEDDYYNERVDAGEFRSLGGRVLDYALDIGEARALMTHDAGHLAQMTEPEANLATLASVHRCTTAWMWFWASRWPIVARREWFREEAERGEARLRVLLCSRSGCPLVAPLAELPRPPVAAGAIVVNSNIGDV